MTHREAWRTATADLEVRRPFRDGVSTAAPSAADGGRTSG
jgi:hypothetical protein